MPDYKVITLRLTEREKADFDEVARIKMTSLNELLRQFVKDQIREVGKTKVSESNAQL
jgi:hypothetical protein